MCRGIQRDRRAVAVQTAMQLHSRLLRKPGDEVYDDARATGWFVSTLV
jgi:hypothetical protein